jgi:hypothetical protein
MAAVAAAASITVVALLLHCPVVMSLLNMYALLSTLLATIA